MKSTQREISSMAEALAQISESEAVKGTITEGKGTMKVVKTPAEVKALLAPVGNVKSTKLHHVPAEETLQGKEDRNVLWCKMSEFDLYRSTAVRDITTLFSGGGVSMITIDDGSIFKKGDIVVGFENGKYVK